MTDTLATHLSDQDVSGRIFNFSAGPAVLPLPVLRQVQSELINYQGAGMSVLEMSHRSSTFEGIIHTAEADLRTLYNIPNNYKVLFLQGGASLQFAMIPMNFLPQGSSADYILSGAWSEAAYKEGKKLGQVRVSASTAAEQFKRIPSQAE
ncbi:MAG: aminotransferase class V-fold PLP-dependent enzyme, partial [Chloroflexota bacterium]